MACELGFISPADCDGLVADAARSNEAGIASTLERVNRLRSASTFHRTHRLDQDAEDELRAPAADPERFAKVARRLHLQFHVNRPTWTWQVESIHDAVLRGASPAQLHWLAGAVRRIRDHQLERSMQQAWSEAFWLGGTVVDDRM